MIDKVKKKSDEKEYMLLWVQYTDRIPAGYLNKVIIAHPDWNAQRITNVRCGKTRDLEIFKAILNLNGINID